jgi:AAA domain
MASFTYADLIEWSVDLPAWQRDALRRVLTQREVSDAETLDLANLAKGPHSDSGVSTATPVPASRNDVQASPAEHPVVRLEAVRNITRVNALAEGPLRFGADGLTLVYGANATGKSGIARILKKACWARDAGGSVRSNVFEPESSEPPQATIDFLVGAEQRSHLWTAGGVAEAHLRTVNVFDARCADVQIEEPSLISYTPEILHTFRSLAVVVDRVADKLRSERDSLGARPVDLNGLVVDWNTAAGRFVASITAESDLDDLKKLCAISETDRERIPELQRALADDSVEKARVEEARGRRLSELELMTADAAVRLSDEALARFADSLGRWKTTRQAATIAREAFAEESIFKGIGTDVWRTLWESARRYSEVHAYSTEPFPVVREGAVCVLCEQALSGEAAARMHSFEQFLQTDVQQRADAAKAELVGLVEGVRSLSLPRFARSSVTDALPLGSADEVVMRRFLVSLKLRRRHLLRMADGKPAGKSPDLPPYPNFRPFQRSIQEEIRRLHSALESEGRLRMERELAELLARDKLAQHVETVTAEIGRLQAVGRLEAAIADCRTQPITLKAREAATKIITDRLRSDFSTNLFAMGLSETPVEVRLGPGEHGKHPYEMKLMPRPEVPPEEVLSEGERTCVGLAGFLAELETTDNRSAIVLDDPVSSLDHRYRKRVAERLVHEAKGRQVIILTHDIVFLYLLRKYARELNIALNEVSLERGYKRGYGRATEGPPWVAMSVKQRITKLRDDLAGARKTLMDGERSGYESKATEIYRRLRQSWERAVEEVLLNETVVRFGDAVQTQRLAKLTDVSDSDVEMVTKEMSRCSDFVHDEAGAVYADVPEPDIIEGDIRRLDDWVKDLRRNRGRS